jgi:hypothetical protein
MRAPVADRGKRLRLHPHASVKALFGTATCEDHPTLVAWKAIGDVPFYFDSYDVARGYLLASDAWSVMPSWTVAWTKGALVVAAELGDEKTTRIAALRPKHRPLAVPLAKLHAAAAESLGRSTARARGPRAGSRARHSSRRS